MFTIEARTDSPAPVLTHGPGLFHEALKGGEPRYHVNREGTEGYDIVYTRNYAFVEPIMPPQYKYITIFFDFLEYDEDNRKFLVLDVFRNYKKVVFLEVNEYSIVLGRLICEELRVIDIFYTDPRIMWFMEPSEKLHVGEELPADGEDVYFVTAPLGHSYGDSRGNKMSILTVFQSVFFLQALTDKSIDRIKYIHLVLDSKTTGIGAIFLQANRLQNMFTRVGWKTFITEESLGKYSKEMLDKYFHLSMKPDDATEENTIYIGQETASAIRITYTAAFADIFFDTGLVRESFIAEMKEYADAVIAGKKMLGVYIRGTDYITSGMIGTFKQASCEEMIPKIYEWIELYGFDGIFLATEDRDVLEKMRMEFGSMIRTVAQERYSVSDFISVKLIAELEDRMYKDDKDEHVEDMLVNYFYAMYTLAQCDSMIASGWCNGVTIVESFNGGCFAHNYRFSVGVK